MSFIKKAQEAAVQAAEVARARAQDAAAAANRTATDPATAETLARGARDAVGMARRGVTTVIEKIDPATLADLIIKATALQELTNKSLRKKGSPYRIAEISISASIPPAVSFAIGRIGEEPEEVLGDVVASSDLVDQSVEASELVLALDGTTVDTSAVAPTDVDA
jgi:type II secretory pathway pseudopilin PulG